MKNSKLEFVIPNLNNMNAVVAYFDYHRIDINRIDNLFIHKVNYNIKK